MSNFTDEQIQLIRDSVAAQTRPSGNTPGTTPALHQKFTQAPPPVMLPTVRMGGAPPLNPTLAAARPDIAETFSPPPGPRVNAVSPDHFRPRVNNQPFVFPRLFR